MQMFRPSKPFELPPDKSGKPYAPGFNPEDKDYDYDTARAAGMGPDGKGENAGHWGSVAPASEADRKAHGLPEESYIMLKGRRHETWDKGVEGEKSRGFDVVKRGNRYYSIKNERSGGNIIGDY